MSELTGRHILVTRPAQQAGSLLAAIREQGGEAVHQPVMAIVPLDDTDHQTIQQCKQQFMNLDSFHIVIFISGNAVHHGLQWIDQYWPQLPVGVQWYGIGRTTTAKLVEGGVPAVSTELGGAMDSEALLQRPELQQLDYKKILIVRGVGGREFLAKQLQARGAQVEYAECYRRTIANTGELDLGQLIRTHNIDTVCINSGQSLDYFLQMLGSENTALLADRVVIVPGTRVAELAAKAGVERIVCAANASDQAVMAAIMKAHKSQ